MPVEFEETLSKKDSFNETIMNGLRLIEGAEIQKLDSLINQNLENYIDSFTEKWPYINNDGKNLSLNKKGLLFADEIIADLFLI